jgi:hypothetical protein
MVPKVDCSAPCEAVGLRRGRRTAPLRARCSLIYDLSDLDQTNRYEYHFMKPFIALIIY